MVMVWASVGCNGVLAFWKRLRYLPRLVLDEELRVVIELEALNDEHELVDPIADDLAASVTSQGAQRAAKR